MFQNVTAVFRQLTKLNFVYSRHATYLNIVLKLMVKRLLQLPEALDAEQTSLVEAIQRCLLLLCACDPRTVKACGLAMC